MAARAYIGRSIRNTDVNQTLVQAINSRHRLRFVYNGRERTVEPQCYGIGTRGTELLRVYQLAGGTQAEPRTVRRVEDQRSRAARAAVQRARASLHEERFGDGADLRSAVIRAARKTRAERALSVGRRSKLGQGLGLCRMGHEVREPVCRNDLGKHLLREVPTRRT